MAALTMDAAPSAYIAPDPALPGSGSLAGGLGATAVSQLLREMGLRVIGQRPTQILYYPGRSMLVRHTAWAEPRHGGESKRYSVCTEISCDGRWPESDSVRSLDVAGIAIQAWVFPADPGLPGLTEAMDPAIALELVRQQLPGVRSVAPSPVSYRPGRRAVLRYKARLPRSRGGSTATYYLKVMTPEDAERTWNVAAHLRGRPGALALPVARPAETLLLFEELQGRGLREVLLSGGALPSPSRVVALMDQVESLGPLPVGDAGRPASAGLRHASKVLSAIVPGSATRIAALRQQLRETLANHPMDHRLIHGDFYEGQVMVGQDFELALLDLDDIGMGDPALDAASFCAHLVALADSNPRASAALLAYRAMLRDAFMQRFDLAEEGFAAREALIMLQLASGPFRVLEADWPARVRRRISLAETLLADRAPVPA